MSLTACTHELHLLIHADNMIKGRGNGWQLDQFTHADNLEAYTSSVKQTTSPTATGNTTATSTMISMGVASSDTVGSGSLGSELSSNPVRKKQSLSD